MNARAAGQAGNVERQTTRVNARIQPELFGQNARRCVCAGRTAVRLAVCQWLRRGRPNCAASSNQRNVDDYWRFEWSEPHAPFRSDGQPLTRVAFRPLVISEHKPMVISDLLIKGQSW
jgi:hypothetical protein